MEGRWRKMRRVAIKVYSSVFMFLSAPFSEVEPSGAQWSHMVAPTHGIGGNEEERGHGKKSMVLEAETSMFWILISHVLILTRG